MTCIFNYEIFNKYRQLAVTDVDDIIIGNTYYTNFGSKSFTVTGLETYKEHQERLGLPVSYQEDKIGWISCGADPWDSVSLSDHNIGAHYNPWLIFEDAETAEACRNELKVTIHDDWYDDHDYNDWDFDDYERDEEFENENFDQRY